MHRYFSPKFGINSFGGIRENVMSMDDWLCRIRFYSIWSRFFDVRNMKDLFHHIRCIQELQKWQAAFWILDQTCTLIAIKDDLSGILHKLLVVTDILDQRRWWMHVCWPMLEPSHTHGVNTLHRNQCSYGFYCYHYTWIMIKLLANNCFLAA